MRVRIEKVVAALVAVATLGFASGAVVASETGEPKTVTLLVREKPKVVTERAIRDRPAERPAGKRGEVRYVVKRGDTLWGIAARNYENAAEGMRRIKRRNGLDREKVLAGEVLVLPARGRG